MTQPELIAMLKSESAFFASLPDVLEAVLYGSALQEQELNDDVDLMIVPSREMPEGEKIDLRQAVWAHFKDRLPVMLEVVTPTAELNPEALVAAGVPRESVYQR